VVNFIEPAAAPPEKYLAPKPDAKADDPPVENPEFEKWVTKDQHVLSYLLHSISPKIASQITAAKMESAAWAAIQGLHAS
jgi:VanZ family protein